MTRKIISLSLVLILLGPALGLLCSCCPSAEASTPSVPILTSEECGCCSEAAQIQGEKLGVNRNPTSWFLSSFQRVFSILALIVSPSLDGLLVSFSGKHHNSGPPARSSEIPLFLSLRNLRL